jgi:phosphatidylserine/phosphatidylglycerophosphate/cardiolipin synthase-like enzyme
VAHLVAVGIAVSLDVQHAWAHARGVILDGVTVIIGSYNCTVAAEQQNGENLLVIHEARLAELYAEDWRRHAHHSSPNRPKVPWWRRRPRDPGVFPPAGVTRGGTATWVRMFEGPAEQNAG